VCRPEIDGVLDDVKARYRAELEAAEPDDGA